MDSDSENQDKLIPSTSNFEALRAIYDPELESTLNECHSLQCQHQLSDKCCYKWANYIELKFI